MKNIQVINRALNLIEAIACSTSGVIRLKDLAKITDLNTATVARILNSLRNRGYVEQIGRNEGYVLGGMFHQIASKSYGRKDLLPKFSSIVLSLADQTEEAVVLASLHDYRRISLIELESSQQVQIQKEITQKYNLYDSATGRVLLAHLPENDFHQFLDRFGLPGKKWPNIDSIKSLRDTCTKIQAADHYLKHDDEIISIASPVFESGRAIAAVGIYLPTYRFASKQHDLIKFLINAANLMTHKLKCK